MDQQTNIKKDFELAKECNKPKINYVKNGLAAFFVGGTICVIAQIINNILFYEIDLAKEEAGIFTTIIMVFLGALLTGIGIYDKIGRFAGAGSIVPITGFANSIVSCALEFKPEGIVFGIGAKMFNVAGPVIVFGITSSWLYGLIYYLTVKL